MKHFIILLASIALCPFSFSQQITWFEDDFSSAEKSNKTWRAFSGVWNFAEGNVSISTREYDQGLSSDIFLFKDKRFSIETRVKGSRAGIYFSLDDVSSKANSQMVRFEGQSMLWGYFNSAGEYNPTGTVEARVKPDQWNTLRIDVDPVRRQYKIFVNGDSVGLDDRMMFASGYFGLEASDGLCEFDNIRVTGFGRLSSTADYKIKPHLQIDHLTAIGVVDGQVVCVNRIVGLAQLIDETSKIKTQYGPLVEPFIGGVAVSAKKEIYVVNQSIKVWNQNGKFLQSFGDDVLKTPVAVAVDDAGRSYVIDEKTLKVFDGNRKYEMSVAQFVTSSNDTIAFTDPKNLCVKGDLLFIADAGLHEIVVVSTKDFHLVKIIDSRLSAPWDVKVDEAGTVFVADAGNRAVMKFGRDGSFLGAFYARSIDGLFAPRGVALSGEELLVADMERIVITDTAFFDVKPKALFHSPTEAEIRWQSATEDFGSVEYSAKDWQQKNYLAVGGSVFEHSIRIKDLNPLTRYTYRVKPCLRTIPENTKFSCTYRFATPPAEKGLMAYTTLRNLILVYRNVTYRDMYPERAFPNIPVPRRLTEEDINYIKSGATFNREFYFRNSSCKLNLDFDVYVVEETLGLKEIGRGNPGPYWLEPTDRVADDAKKAAQDFGRKPEDYAGVIAVYSWVNYPTRGKTSSDSIKIQQAVGGGTNGIPAPWRYGKTTGYTGNPFPDRASRQDWLITHTYHHQLNSLFDQSGLTGYYHADMPWKMPGRFGEDFDFNAKIIRMAASQLGIDCWLNLKFGELKATEDKDSDGVPDNDPSLPFDEKRLNGKDYLKDTDNDGLDDLHEVMAGDALGTDLDNADTDGDGLTDSIDPEPLYAMKPERPKWTGHVDGTLEKGWSYFASVADTQLHGSIYSNWDSDNSYFAFRLNLPVDVRIQIDANSDGWFHGADNVFLQIANSGESARVTDYYLWDASSWTEVPRAVRNGFVKPDDITLGYSNRGGANVTEIAIPRNEKVGLTFGPQKKISVRFGLKLKDRWDWIELFERNYMMECKLVDVPPAKKLEEIKAFLDNIEKGYQTVYKKWAEAEWNYTLETTNAVYQRDAGETEKNLRDVVRRPDVFEQIKEYIGTTDDPDLKARLQLLYSLFLSSAGVPKELDGKIIELENRLSATWSSQRPSWVDKEGAVADRKNGKLTLVEDVTGTLEKIEDEDDRAEVYTRRSSIGKLIAGSGFRELIRLRNQAARQVTIGDRRFEDYFSFQMYVQGLDEAKLADFYQRVLKGTEPAYSANLQGLKDQFGNKVLYPYNIPYFEKRSERFGLGRSDASAYIPQGKIRSIAVETMKGIGLDFGAPPLGKAIVDIENRPGKYPAMQIYAAEAHGDVRVSVPARLDSWTAEREMLCGLGEATYYASCVKSPSSLLAALRKYQALANACGDIAGSLIYDPEWWDRYTALPDSLLSKLSGRLRFDHLSDVRKTIVAALFEKEIYRNPDADFDQIWWNLAEKHLKLRRVEDEDGNLVSEWGLFPELFGQPLRLQNGVLGCIAAAQIRTRLERDNKSVVGNPKTGSFLIEKMCGYGLDLNWEEVLQTATGEPLDPNFLIEKLTR